MKKLFVVLLLAASFAQVHAQDFVEWQANVTDYNQVLSTFDLIIAKEAVPPASAYYNRGIVKSKLNDPYGAISDFTQVLLKEPDNADAYSLRGIEKAAKIIAQTKTLSTASDFSITKPEKYCCPSSAPYRYQISPPKPTPRLTQISDHQAASFTLISAASRCANRSAASITRMMPKTVSQSQRGTSNFLLMRNLFRE